MNPASQNFHERAKAFARANPGMVHVVRKGQDDESVRAWFTYFHTRGQSATIETFRRILAENGAVQFPCRLPEHFEPSYEAPRYSWREPEERPLSRGDVSRVVQDTLASLRGAQPKGRAAVQREHLADPVQSPQEWLKAYAANPPPVPVFSEEFKARMNLPSKYDQAAE